jgi:uncharacterized membrane protein
MSLLPLALAFVLGFIAGLRSMTPLALVAWATAFGWLELDATPLAFLETSAARYVLGAFMIGELIADKLPFTPSRTRAGPFAARIASGALAGAALLAGADASLLQGAIAGALGAVAGTLGGYQARTGLVRRFRLPDLAVALAEDIVAVGGALLVLSTPR